MTIHEARKQMAELPPTVKQSLTHSQRTRFTRKMTQISKIDDTEIRHKLADNLMVSMLEELGFTNGLDIYKRMEKGYA